MPFFLLFKPAHTILTPPTIPKHCDTWQRELLKTCQPNSISENMVSCMVTFTGIMQAGLLDFWAMQEISHVIHNTVPNKDALHWKVIIVSH